jgi:hypothetical protein
MTVVMKPCKVPWSVSPTMSGLTLTYMEPDVAPECSIVFGAGRMGPHERTDSRRIELQFVMASHVRASPKRDDEDIEASGFHIVGRYDGPSQGYLKWITRNWRDTGICPDPGFYVATESDWLRSATMKYGHAPKHFILKGRECYMEILAESFSWREWLWPDGARDIYQHASDVVGSGHGTE